MPSYDASDARYARVISGAEGKGSASSSMAPIIARAAPIRPPKNGHRIPCDRHATRPRFARSPQVLVSRPLRGLAQVQGLARFAGSMRYGGFAAASTQKSKSLLTGAARRVCTSASECSCTSETSAYLTELGDPGEQP